MKLRSGKIVPYKPGKLPKKLEDRLDELLEDFKGLFAGDSQHARELLDLINETEGYGIRGSIRNKIAEEYNWWDQHIFTKAYFTAGGLMCLLISSNNFYTDNEIEPIYHDVIQARIENFKEVFELPLLGNMEGSDV